MNKDLNNLVIQIRRDILRMVHDVNSGHPGGSLGCVEFFVTLYKRILNITGRELNTFEKSQAVVNAVLEQGREKFQTREV